LQSVSGTANITYAYGVTGQRVSKAITGGATTYYVRDASGNTVALYDNAGGTVNWKEQHLYGSARLGIWTPGDWRYVGNVAYELTDHRSNVLSTISDKRLQVDNGSGGIGYFTPDVFTASDTYSFGMAQPGRQYGSAQKYGYNGKENDNDIGNSQNYGMREYDQYADVFWSVDPITGKYPELTPYQFASNTPIQAIDLDGKEESHYTLTYNEKTGVSILKTVSVKQMPSTNLFGTPYPGGQIQRAIVKYNNDTYRIGFSGDDLVTMQVFNIWKQHPNAQIFEKLFLGDRDRGDGNFVNWLRHNQDYFLQQITSIVPLGFVDFEPVTIKGGGKGAKQINEEVRKISNGKGTPRLDENGNQKIFENRKNTAVERKWAGASEWEVNVPGESNTFRILQKEVGTDSDGNPLYKYGWSKNHYEDVYEINVKPAGKK